MLLKKSPTRAVLLWSCNLAKSRMAVLVRILAFNLMVMVLMACGNSEIPAAAKNGNILANTIDLDGLSSCSDELLPISSSFTGFFSSYGQNSPYLISYITDHVEENSFNQALKDLIFTKDDPCKQLQVAFSGAFANNVALKLKISKADAHRNLTKIKHFNIIDFSSSYLDITNSAMPDNISRLPEHHFEVNVSCPTGITFACYSGEEKCDASKPLKAKFPDEPCTIKGNNQVFALYPSGQIIIDFEGVITKIKTTENDIDEVDIKFTNIKWR
jgi:hypothetical protein